MERVCRLFLAIGVSAPCLLAMALLEEAATAERDAARIETEGLPTNGEARAEGLDELLVAVTAQGGSVLYPELAAIEDWARGCEATLKRIEPTLMNAPRTYRLAWRRGVIDTGTSSLWVGARYFRPTGEGDLIEPAA